MTAQHFLANIPGMARTRTLSEKQRRFVEAFMGKAAGNATEAAKLAGYKGSTKTLQVVGSENLAKPIIRDAIKKRGSSDTLVMDRKSRQKWWTDVIMGKEFEGTDMFGKAIKIIPTMMTRIRASELLGKCGGDFITRIEATGKDGAPLIPTWLDLAKDAERIKKEARQNADGKHPAGKTNPKSSK